MKADRARYVPKSDLNVTTALEARPGLGFGPGQPRDQCAGGMIRLWLNAGGGLTTLTKLIIPLSS